MAYTASVTVPREEGKGCPPPRAVHMRRRRKVMHLASSGDISTSGRLRTKSTLSLTARLDGRTPRHSYPFRTERYPTFSWCRKSTSQWQARSHEVVPSALVYSKGGVAGERTIHNPPLRRRKFWLPHRQIHTFTYTLVSHLTSISNLKRTSKSRPSDESDRIPPYPLFPDSVHRALPKVLRNLPQGAPLASTRLQSTTVSVNG